MWLAASEEARRARSPRGPGAATLEVGVDRGTIEVGKGADLNFIDLDNLSIGAPEMVFDLPGGGRRLVQKAEGYKATIVAGEVTFEDGEPTGARPGRLVRAGRR